jgi:gluconolactonase
VTSAGLPANLVPSDAKATADALLCFLEGPAVDADGNVYFSDIAGSRIHKKAPDGKLTIFREDSGRTNGNTVDLQNRLVSCEGAEFGPHGRRRITRTDLKTGKYEVLTDRFEGKRYNSPNDVVCDRLGRIWFTDPYYGPDRDILELDHESLYRIDPDGQVERVLTQPKIQRPNGLAMTPDGKTLYVIDSHPQPGGHRKVWAFEVTEQGTLAAQRLVYDFGKGRGGDGMRLDETGNLWIAAGILTPRHGGENTDVPPGVYVVTPQGKLLGRIPVPEDVITNLTFAGTDRKTVYVTAGKTLYKFQSNVAGAVTVPK